MHRSMADRDDDGAKNEPHSHLLYLALCLYPVGEDTSIGERERKEKNERAALVHTIKRKGL